MLNPRWLDAMEFRFSASDHGLHLKRVRDIDLATTFLTSGLGAAGRADCQDVLGFDGDLYLLMIRVRLPATFTRPASRARVRP
jgi:hypothetical protein